MYFPKNETLENQWINTSENIQPEKKTKVVGKNSILIKKEESFNNLQDKAYWAKEELKPR